METEVKMRGIRVSNYLWDKVKQQAEREHRSVGKHVTHILHKAVKNDELQKKG